MLLWIIYFKFEFLKFVTQHSPHGVHAGSCQNTLFGHIPQVVPSKSCKLLESYVHITVLLLLVNILA